MDSKIREYPHSYTKNVRIHSAGQKKAFVSQKRLLKLPTFSTRRVKKRKGAKRSKSQSEQRSITRSMTTLELRSRKLPWSR